MQSTHLLVQIHNTGAWPEANARKHEIWGELLAALLDGEHCLSLAANFIIFEYCKNVI